MTSNQQLSSRIQRGAPAFTLIELLLVMALLTIVISVGVPTLSGFFRGRTLDNEARRMLALSRYAKSLAISEGLPVAIWFDERNRKYGLEQDYAYDDIDSKTNMVFTLDKDVDMEVVMIKRPAVVSQNNVTGNRGRLTLTPIVVQPGNPHRNFPCIRYLEDGTVAENSPEVIRLKGRGDETLYLAQMHQPTSANNTRPNYAIRSQGFEIRNKENPLDERDLYR